MNKTKIDWADSTWNPVTGCLNDCSYCYARGQTNRFKGYLKMGSSFHDGIIHDLSEPYYKLGKNLEYVKAPCPYNFEPTLHRYHLDDYKNKKGCTIFVGSMTDLFGEWVPDEWIKKVFKACENAPQHRYLFLTKNPRRYLTSKVFEITNFSKNYWYGTTITCEDDIENAYDLIGWSIQAVDRFLSIEPLQQNIDISEFVRKNYRKELLYSRFIDWVIIGAETGNRKDKIIPKREWIENIVNECRANKVPVFMKSSLADIWGEELIREYPWEVNHA